MSTPNNARISTLVCGCRADRLSGSFTYFCKDHTLRIGTTRFGCGCTVHAEPDINGIAPWLEHCPRHAAIDKMVPLLRTALEVLEPGDADVTKPEPEEDPNFAWACEARAVLAEVGQ